MTASFSQIILFTDNDGRARFQEQAIALTEGKPQAMLSPLMPSAGMQLRQSPVGFRSEFHCTGDPQWVFILSGQIDPRVHGHWSRQVGAEPLVTLFVRA
ncbi:MAG: hypothetical protein EBY28_12160 [Betaproteobacteria bacterium]|nr:hypothetical protein [Betaproteobacteria bacterium]